MSDGQIILLGAIAGLTIFLGLPVGRMRNLSSEMRCFFNDRDRRPDLPAGGDAQRQHRTG